MVEAGAAIEDVIFRELWMDHVDYITCPAVAPTTSPTAAPADGHTPNATSYRFLQKIVGPAHYFQGINFSTARIPFAANALCTTCLYLGRSVSRKVRPVSSDAVFLPCG